VDVIKIKVSAVIIAISEALPVQNENSLSIKLPDYIELTNVSTFIKGINTILNQTLVDHYRTTIKLQNFDSGSNWIEIVLNNPEAIVYFGYIYKAATELLRTEYIKWREMEHYIKMLAIDEQTKTTVLEGLKNEFNAKAKLNAKILMEKGNISPEQHEYHTNLTSNITQLTEYLSKGAEVHTALNAPEETQEVYPNVQDTQKLIEGAVKLLTSSKEEHSETSDE
jgi:hypothetical protein